MERASVDEAYIDLTEEVEARLSSLSGESVTESQVPNTYIVGYDGKEEEEKKGLYSNQPRENACLLHM